MTIGQLRYFIEVAKKKSFTAAAEGLFVSQSTLSKSIRALETEFQCDFINRQSKEFALTCSGRSFLSHAKKIVEDFDRETNIIYSELHENGGTLHLGLPPTTGVIYFYKIINRFRKEYPNVDLSVSEVTSKSIIEDMEKGLLDIGIVIQPFKDVRFYSQNVYSSEIVILVSKNHPLATLTEISLKDLKNENFVMLSQGWQFHDVVMNYCQESGFKPNVIFESSQWDMIYEMVSENQGIALLPKPLLDKYEDGRTHQIHCESPILPWTLTAIYRRDKFVTAPMRHFLELCDRV